MLDALIKFTLSIFHKIEMMSPINVICTLDDNDLTFKFQSIDAIFIRGHLTLTQMKKKAFNELS